MTDPRPIYLDYNATTPIDPRVAEAMRPYLTEGWGNPSSSHWFGLQAKSAVDSARRQVADLLGCRPDEVIFTSGGSESNNFAIKGAVFSLRGKGNHIVTTQIEHPAVIQVCRYLEKEGFTVTYLPVDETGIVSVADVERAITPATILITVMHANNEVGSIQPISEIARLARSRDILMHTDAAQSVGKIPVRLDDLGVDMISVAGHKLYAPKGIGVLVVRSGVELARQIHGADHERGWRAGTENVLEAVGLGAACSLVAEQLDADMVHSAALRDRLWQQFETSGLDVKRNGHPEQVLPNTLSVSFAGVEANTLLAQLTDVAASAGAACHTDQVDVSSVLEAMAVPIRYAMGTVRLSVGRFTTADEVGRAAEKLIAVARSLAGSEGGSSVPDTDPDAIQLTRFTHGMGCACKIRPQLLEEILRKLPVAMDPDILVGANASDDAAVVRLTDETALVATVDFFTPVVDDPYTFGTIAAANALSDVYAMGATPLLALNIVGFPVDRLPMTVLEQILQGGQDKAAEAGIYILGGHSIEDTEPKYGMVVIGTVHPDRVLTNASARAGDVLVLTKPLGTGILATALKQGLLEKADANKAAETMGLLNKKAADVMRAFDISACTDITGFGLMGHLLEMVRGSGVGCEISVDRVPVIDRARELALAGVVPGGTRNNLAHVNDSVKWDRHVPETERLILCDAQTSGGLLIAVAPEQCAAMVDMMLEEGVLAAQIGLLTRGPVGKIKVRMEER